MRSGHESLTPTEENDVSLQALCCEALELLRPMAEKKGIRIVNEDFGQPLNVRGSRKRLLLVVRRLLADALTSTRRCGRIRLQLGSTGDGVQMRITGTSDHALWEILTERREAAGAGSTYSKNEPAGTPVDLFDIVRSFRGRILVETARGRDYSVTVTLPMASIG